MTFNNGQCPQQPVEKFRKQIENYSYFVHNKLGSGYSSEVFRGIDDRNGSIVAIKVINLARVRQKGLQDMLNRQIRLLREVKHDNIISCLDVLKTTNNCYIVTEYCAEGDLAQFISRKAQISEEHLLHLVRGICLGLSFLHSRGILHRDIKPQNILLLGRHPKIADFGFALKSQKPVFQRFKIGSPLYMSPEALNNSQYSFKNDIWALGITFFELMEGKAPWNAKNQSQLKQLIKGQLKFKNTKSRQLQGLISGCLAYDSSFRLSSDELLTKIQSYLGIRSYVNWSVPETNENNERCNGGEESQELKKAMRNNYNILKWVINYSRFAAKLLPKIQEDLKCQQAVRKPLIQFTARILHLNISKLSKIDESHSQLGLLCFPQFKRTSRFSKIQAVTKQYQQRYLLLLTKLPYSYYISPSFSIPSTPLLYQSLDNIPIDTNCTQEHLLVIEFFMIMLNTNVLNKQAQPLKLIQMINFQKLVEQTPPFFNEALVRGIAQKKQRIIRQGIPL